MADCEQKIVNPRGCYAVLLLLCLAAIYARGQIQPSTPEGLARSPALAPPYDPRPLIPGLPLEDRGIPSYADPRFQSRLSPYSGKLEKLESSVNDGFILVKGSSFLMGGHERSQQAAPHRVQVGDFWVSPYEVYWKLWNDVFRWAVQHGYQFISSGTVMELDQFTSLDKSVAQVSWYDAIIWLNAYSELRQLQPVYLVNSTVFRYVLRSAVEVGLLDRVYVNWAATGYRLPTEAEWEFAARGGLSGRATLYSGSNNPLDAGWFRGNVPQPRLQSAGLLYHNGLGLYDMSGNLAEWCWDWYQEDYYYQSPAVDPRGPASGMKRVIRGGSWNEGTEAMLVASRQAAYPKALSPQIGFRAVRRAIYLPQNSPLPSTSEQSNVSQQPPSGDSTALAEQNSGKTAATAPSSEAAAVTGNASNGAAADYVYSLYSQDLIHYNGASAYRE